MTSVDTLGAFGLLRVMAAFVATLTGRLRPTARLCLLLNGVGAAMLGLNPKITQAARA